MRTHQNITFFFAVQLKFAMKSKQTTLFKKTERMVFRGLLKTTNKQWGKFEKNQAATLLIQLILAPA